MYLSSVDEKRAVQDNESRHFPPPGVGLWCDGNMLH